MNLFNHFLIVSTSATISAPLFAADYLTEAQAQKILFPAADKFIKLDIELTSEQLDKIKDQSGVRQRNKKPLIWRVEAKGIVIGFFFVDEVIGKHEYITYSLGITSKGETLGIEIMSYRETHGGEVRNETWRKNFVGKKLSDVFKLDVDVPNISGATLSCRNILDGVKRLLILQRTING
ncbi:MAG: FMN-binding protein [Bdellovibrionaceae bacterium]|nr:FMN-binding protein [Pseudobdellovibrionaceae bacterium]